MNIRFNYLYRDASNYKKHNAEVFSNKANIPIAEIDTIIRSVLIDGEWFYNEKWGLPDLHFNNWDEDIDHHWHEYNCVEETADNVTMGDIFGISKTNPKSKPQSPQTHAHGSKNFLS